MHMATTLDIRKYPGWSEFEEWVRSTEKELGTPPPAIVADQDQVDHMMYLASQSCADKNSFFWGVFYTLGVMRTVLEDPDAPQEGKHEIDVVSFEIASHLVNVVYQRAEEGR